MAPAGSCTSRREDEQPLTDAACGDGVAVDTGCATTGITQSRAWTVRVAGVVVIGLALAAAFAAAPPTLGRNSGTRSASIPDREAVFTEVVELAVARSTADCSKVGTDCSTTQCCSDPGMQCYEKEEGGTATCKAGCVEDAPDVTDKDKTHWTCNPLGDRAEGSADLALGTVADWVADYCTEPKDNCFKTKCCTQPGTQCYAKNDHYAGCKATCTPGPDPTDVDGDDWSCKELGSRTPGVPPEEPEDFEPPAWVEKQCSKPGADCSKTKCCAWAGMQCFEKADGYAACKGECVAGPDFRDGNAAKWSCNPLGGRTPGKGIVLPPIKKLPAWAETKCSKPGQNCSDSWCCTWAGMQCYKKDGAEGDNWAACKASCNPGPDPLDGNPNPWSCKELGPRTPGEAMPPADDLKPAKWVAHRCAKSGADCRESQCCATGGEQCYAKNKGWAVCRAGCTEGPQLEDLKPEKWSCKMLGSRTPGKITPLVITKAPAWMADHCTKAVTDCSETMCCVEPGTQCYQKKEGWATCRVSCNPGPDPSDMDSIHWTCKMFGPRTPGEPKITPIWDMQPAKWVASTCAKDGTDCSEAKCCASPGMQCYEKKAGWATCRASCNAGPDPADADGEWWTCKELGMRTPGQAKLPDLTTMAVPGWVGVQCSKSGDCSKQRCCSGKGLQCYEKLEGWATCKASCAPDAPDMLDVSPDRWSCKPLGGRTPGPVPGIPHNVGPPAWAKDHCSTKEADCAKTRCCQDEGLMCYAKNKYYGQCMAQCTPGNGWSCDPFGMRTPKPWGSPSLFCFSVTRSTGYETDLIKKQIEEGMGIVACDEFAFLCSDPLTINGYKAVPFQSAVVGISKDNTAANTELFLHVWNAIKLDGRYKDLDWTVKVDPDAVLLPDRLRGHLKPYTSQKTYIVNCNKPQMTPMMFGALECISREGMEAYFAGESSCTSGLPWAPWGEDYFMGKCLDKLGVRAQSDYGIYTDGVCTGVNCQNAGAAAFHPFKNTDAWMGCYRTATR